MPPVKFTEVLSFSSEDPNHPADNLLRPDTFRKWKCAAGSSDKQAFVILKLEKLTAIHSVDIGNEGSAFVEVLVAREGGDFQVLLVASSFMTPAESRAGNNLSRVRMFGSDKLNKTVAEQKWDRLKVICTQPFNKNTQYGLSFITVTTSSEKASSSTPKIIKLGSFTLKEEDDSDPISVGSVFARRKDSEGSSPLTGAAAIRAASASAAAAASPGVESKVKPHNAPDVGFYQLKKNAAQERESSKTSQSSKHAASPSESTPSRKHSDKDKERHEKRKNHEDKQEGSHKKRKTQDAREEKNRDKHRKDREKDDKRRPESDKKSEDPKAAQRKRQENDDQNMSSSSSVSSKKKSAPFSALMKDVSFVLSGYQNPQRSKIRDLMIGMGAKYKPDWDKSCTHLICAFANTPKYQQVKGKGRIVNGKWTFDCHKNKIRYPTKRYALDKQKNAEDSEEEIWAEELLPKEEKPSPKPAKPTTDHTSSDVEGSDHGKYSDDTYSDNEDTDDEIQRVLAKKTIKKEESANKDRTSSRSSTENSQKTPNKKRKSDDRDEKPNLMAQSSSRNSAGGEDVVRDMNGTDDNIYDDDTDVDEENKVHLTRPDTAALPLPSLGDYFHGKFFFIYGNMSTEMKQFLSRYILAFDGTLEDYMTSKVNFVITEDDWDDNFDEALADNPSVQFVKSAWIWRCCDRQKLVPFQPFMVVPKD